MEGEVHEFVPQTNSWRKVEPTFAVIQIRWRSHFDAVVDHEDSSLTLALQHDPSFDVDLVSEMSAFLSQQGVNSVGSFTDSKKEEINTNHLSSVFNISRWFSFGLVVLVLLLTVLVLGIIFKK